MSDVDICSLARNNPRLSSTSSQATKTPLVRFALQQIRKIVVHIFIAVHLVPRIFPGLFAPLQYDEFDLLHQKYLRRMHLPRTGHPPAGSGADGINARETLLRTFWAFYWAWCSFAVLDAADAALSVVSVVILRLDRPEDWPPLFGSLSEAHGVRRFWGRFWHRLVVRP